MSAAASAEKLPLRVVHYGRRDPSRGAGGVEAFARRLALVFDEVEFAWPGHPQLGALARDRAIIICDNDTALDWPRELPLVAFQHGVAWQKAWLTHTLTDARMAARQLLAARRRHTVWAACAHWIAGAFGRLHPQAPQHVIFHFVEPERFDGRLDNAGSNLVLHDARSEHKGKRLVEQLQQALPQWRFESLACAPEQVADRMRKAAAFLHLSRYEGNSIVCNEAMAMDLPCIFTDVGLARDAKRGQVELDVALLDAKRCFESTAYLVEQVGQQLATLGRVRRSPRRFMLEHATPAAARERWRAVIEDLARLRGAPIDLGVAPRTAAVAGGGGA
ncbi:MAG: glycosyltransferase [Deltaproteobacteria bacterium]|nr:glycosyltransferase [Deltaproteobacteria bacterium]